MGAISRMFTPPLEEKLTHGVDLQVMSGSLDSEGHVFMMLRAWNGALIHAGRTDGESKAARRSFAGDVVKSFSTLDVDDVAGAIMRTSVRVADLLRADLAGEGEQAPPPADVAGLWLACLPLAQAPELMERIAVALTALGLVGERDNGLLLYLAATARLRKKPVSVVVKGPSSAGKTFLVQTVLKLFPQSAYVDYTAVSPQFLARSDHALEHRIITLYEAGGMTDGVGVYLMRSLLSEGVIRIGTVDKGEGRNLVAQEIKKKGPAALFTTTTLAELDPELETRALAPTIRDDEEQSSAIVDAQAAEYLGIAREPVDLTGFHALQEWLAAKGEQVVTIPYVKELARRVPKKVIRIRRDFPKLLNLIAASALLHQAQREKTAEGVVIASIDDYRIVRALVYESFTTAQQGNVTPKQRETAQAVISLCTDVTKGENGVSVVEVATVLSIHKSNASRHLKALAKFGYIRNLSTRQGQAPAYVPGDPLPEETVTLPTVEDLADATGQREVFEI